MTAASQMLERYAVDEKGLSYLAVLNQGICRMLRIVGRMELAERLAAGQPRLEAAAVDLGVLAAELGARMEGLLEAAGVRLSVKGPESLPAWADGDLIRQMLLELVANAAKAGRQVTVALERLGDNAVFTVLDDGPGMPPERAAYLFSPGEEALPDWRKAGCGVAIAHRIARLHGGTLVADHGRERGMAVIASIPLRQGDGRGLASPAAPRWDGGGFDEALVGLSHLLPARVFAPGDE